VGRVPGRLCMLNGMVEGLIEGRICDASDRAAFGGSSWALCCKTLVALLASIS
jgi:hypothetical protein